VVPAERPVVRRRQWLAGAVGGLLILVVGYYLVSLYGVWAASRLTYQPVADPSATRAVVVLGAAQYNGEPSPVLRARLDLAAELYESGEVELVVVTGGGQAADSTTEAKTGYEYLREQSGIADEELRLEVQGSSTYESLAATALFLRREEVVDVVLVTDRYHAKRSLLVAEEVGLRPQVALTAQPPPARRLLQEAAAVAIGRVISFRRLERL
jgi:vancomycin permeability regulator SanA